MAVCGSVYIACREFINTGEMADETKFRALFLTKTSSPVSSSVLIVQSPFLTSCWRGREPAVHHYTVAQAARKYQPFKKSAPLS